MCSGLEDFWRTSKREGRKPSAVSVILYAVFVATELHPDIISFQHFLPSNDVKIKNYSLLLKVSRNALALLK